jgi:hypothetical protein
MMFWFPRDLLNEMTEDECVSCSVKTKTTKEMEKKNR